jgi:hypothetical protein
MGVAHAAWRLKRNETHFLEQGISAKLLLANPEPARVAKRASRWRLRA